MYLTALDVCTNGAFFSKREEPFRAFRFRSATPYPLHVLCHDSPRHIPVYEYVEQLSGLRFFSSYKQHIVITAPFFFHIKISLWNFLLSNNWNLHRKKEHALQGSVRIISQNLGATLTSELICKQGRSSLERTTAKKMSCKKVRPSNQRITTGTYKLSFQNYLFRHSKRILSRKDQ